MAGLEPDVSAPRTPQTAAEAEVVREQLGRILSSALFRNSKRFPVFLRYTVEHALNSAEPLKERTIGHEAFARDPAYDTAQDPVVRMTAAEVRKRLVQYYQRPEHSREIVIAYQSGSYVPEFSQPATPADTGSPPSPAAKSPRLLPSSRARTWIAATAAGVLASAVLGAWLIVDRQPARPRNGCARPLLDTHSRIVVAAAALHRRRESIREPDRGAGPAAVGDMTIRGVPSKRFG